MDKKEKKEIVEKLREEERKKALAALPLSRNDLADLFDHLDEALSEDCDHTLAKTKAFLKSRNLDNENVLRWLEDHGGHCDCEVLDNVESVCMEIFDIKSTDHLTRDDE